MGYGVVVTPEKVLGALTKRAGLTDLEIARKLGYSDWKKREVRAALRTLVRKGAAKQSIRAEKTWGRPPAEFRRA